MTLGPGLARLTDSLLFVPAGTHYFNRIYDGPRTLASLGLEAFFMRYIGPVPTDIRPIPGRPGGAAGDLKANEYIDLASDRHYLLSEKGQWFDRESGKIIDPRQILVPGSFGIHRVGRPTEFVLAAPAPPPTIQPLLLRQPPNLVLEENAVRRLLGQGFGPPEAPAPCFFTGTPSRPISLYVVESESGHAVIRVGKHPANVTTHSLAAVTGQGFIGRLQHGVNLFAVE